MRVEIINTGTELLLGRVTNTHLGFLAQSLFGLGVRVERQVTVPDGAAIGMALDEAMARADLIVVTGGLGPTSDDITRDAAAEAFGKKLIFHQEILDGIEEIREAQDCHERSPTSAGHGARGRHGAR